MAVAAAALAAVALVPAAAQANVDHKFLYSFTGSSTPAGSFAPTGIAVDNSASASAGKLWVGDYNNWVVDRFAPGASSASYDCQITGEGSASISSSECDKTKAGPGAFSSLYGAAVDPASGAVSVSDGSAELLEQFSAAGVFEQQTSLGTNNGPVRLAAAPGAVFVVDPLNQQVERWDTATNALSTFTTGADTPAGSFGSNSPSGVAVDVDPSSPSYQDVYVVDSAHHVIDKFSSAGTYLCQITGEGSATTSGSECDGTDPGVPGGSFNPVGGLAVDPANGHLYVSEGAQVDEFTASGGFLGSFNGAATPPGSFSAYAIAVSAASDDVFVSDEFNGRVDVFAPDAPDVTTGLPTNVTPTSATFSGTVNPEGFAVSDCHFDYGPTVDYGQTAACVETVGSGTSDRSVHADVTGLQSGQTYHFRLVASNANGTNDGADQVEGPPNIDQAWVDAIAPMSATLHAKINPDNTDTTYHFEYGPTAGYGTNIPATDADVGSGAADVAVSQPVSGLTPGTTYHYRVVATSAAGTVGGPDETFSTEPPALVDIQPPTGMSTGTGLSNGTATLNAYVNPLGADTRVHFEYGTTTGYGTSTATQDAGSGTSSQLQSVQVTGLAPGTTYHYRTVLTNTVGTYDGPDSTLTTPPASCPNASLRTGRSAGLPDCRAFEQVSPEDKGGYPVYYGSPPAHDADPIVAATTGNTVQFSSQGAFAGAPNQYLTETHYLAQRSAGGWSTAALDQPYSAGWNNVVWAFSPDMSRSQWSAITTPDNRQEAFFLRDGTGPFEQASATITAADGGSLDDQHTGRYANADINGVSPDLSHAVVQSNLPLVASDPLPFGDGRLYEWAGLGSSDPQPRLLSIDPAGNPIATDPSCVSAAVVGDAQSGPTGHFNPVSEDGSKIFFTEYVDGGACRPVLYARVDDSSTVDISSPQPNDECTSASCLGSQPGRAGFAGASSDGSKAFFLSPQQLTDDASEDPTDSGEQCHNATAANGCNLYEYDFNRPAGENLVDLSAGDQSGLGPQVRYVLAVADDGSRVYFTSEGALTAQPNALGQVAHGGAYNLYVYDTTADTVGFVAQLCTGAGQSGALSGQAQCFGDDSALADNAFASRPDGRYLAFTSYGQLTPDDTNQAADVYEYDAVTGGLWRVSVGHDGEDQNGNAGGQDAILIPSQTAPPESVNDALAHRPMSDDGQTVVFASARALQSQASNGLVNAYEWRQGEVSLVSGGQASNNVEYVVTTPSGSDIFFNTDQGLVPSDVDGLNDVYDARIDGGFPAPANPSAPCTGDACQGPPSGSPLAPVAASVAFSGPGDDTPSSGGHPPLGKARVVTRTVLGARFTVAVQVPGAGRITVTGPSVKSASKVVPRSGTYRVRVSLTARERSALRRRHKLRLTLRVAYASAGLSARTVTFDLTVKR